MLHISLLVVKASVKPSLLFSLLWCSLCFQRILLFRTYSSSLELVLCRLAAVKCLPVHHHSADYVFFWSVGILNCIKVRIHVTAITQINKSVVYFTVKRNVMLNPCTLLDVKLDHRVILKTSFLHRRRKV